MNKVLISVLAVMSSSTMALANGDHSNPLLHMLTEPDHLAMLSLVVVAALIAARKLRAPR